MPRSIGNTIADSLDQGRRYGDTLLKGVDADQFARFATPAGESIVSNHPAFIYGHLSLYGPRIVTGLGGDETECGVPEAFAAVFSKDAVCQDDPGGSIYPEMEQVVAAFASSYAAASAALRAADDSAFGVDNPVGGNFAERFPTLGSAITFYSGGHMMLHLGQMSAWRRMSGLGAA